VDFTFELQHECSNKCLHDQVTKMSEKLKIKRCVNLAEDDMLIGSVNLTEDDMLIGRNDRTFQLQ